MLRVWTEAARRLRESEESVAQVAERVGYANAAAFMKAFTRVHGAGAYRSRHRRRAEAKPGEAREEAAYHGHIQSHPRRSVVYDT